MQVGPRRAPPRRINNNRPMVASRRERVQVTCKKTNRNEKTRKLNAGGPERRGPHQHHKKAAQSDTTDQAADRNNEDREKQSTTKSHLGPQIHHGPTCELVKSKTKTNKQSTLMAIPACVKIKGRPTEVTGREKIGDNRLSLNKSKRS